MDGKTHKIFSPIFTLGASFALVKTGVINHTENEALIVLIATLSSTFTSVSADADLHSYKPMYVIWDKRPRMKKGNKYEVKLKNGKIAKYTVPKRFSMKVWASIFKTLGVTKHRDWRSHSPSVWIPLTLILYKLSVTLTSSLPIDELKTFIPSIVAGMGLGYLSHIAADASNKGGIPLLFSNKQFSITRKLFGKHLSNFFKSGNKIYNYIFIAIGVDIVLFIFAPEFAKSLNTLLFRSIILLGKGVYTILFGILGGVFTGLKAMIGS